MDNKIFNVNGVTKSQFELSLKLALHDQYFGERLPGSWEIMPDKGFVLNWGNHRGKKFEDGLTMEKLIDILWTWISSSEARKIPMEGWDADADHDGSNELGFRIFCDDWGHVGNNSYAIVCIKPAYIWYGK